MRREGRIIWLLVFCGLKVVFSLSPLHDRENIIFQNWRKNIRQHYCSRLAEPFTQVVTLQKSEVADSEAKARRMSSLVGKAMAI